MTKLEKFNLILTRVTLTDKLFFTKNLYLMVKTSIPLGRALNSLSIQTENKKLKAVLGEVQERIEKGAHLSQALAEHPRIFSDIFVNMIEAGEESGKLEETLQMLSVQMYKEHTLKAAVKGALAYPIVVILAIVSITTGLVVFVVPNITKMLIRSDVALPLPTKILIAVSSFMVNNIYLVFFIFVIIVVLFLRVKKTVIGKKIFHKIVLHIPILGKLVKKVNLARSCRSLSSLLKTDIPVIQAFIIVSKVVNNIYFQEALKNIADELKKGIAINEAFNKHLSLFNPTVVQMVAIGEETGTLDDNLSELAQFYEEELDNTLKNLPSILEPILILILGVTVGGIVLAIMLPILKLTTAFT